VIISQLETPALILDLDIFAENLQAMDSLLKGSKAKLRPHYKSHKCTYIAHRQIEAGAKGITCAKLGEAEDLAQSGIKDILIANQIVQKSKIVRLAQLAKTCKLTVCVDNADNIADLSRMASEAGSVIYCLVEFDIGMKRCGVSDFETFYRLAAKIDSAKNLVFEGIQAYAGHLSHETDDLFRAAEVEKLEIRVLDLKKYLLERKLPVREISGGSTGTVQQKAQNGVYTEIQAGSYIFMDQTYRGLDTVFKNGLFLVSTVISTHPDRFILDAGIKSCSPDQGMPGVMKYPDCEIAMNEEHAVVRANSHNAVLGESVLLVPGHCCSTINLYDQIYLVRGKEVVDRIKVTSRGKNV